MTSGNPSIHSKKATAFLKAHTENKRVVGISAVYYAMSGTKPIKDAEKAGKLPVIPQPVLLDSLKKKLNDILSSPDGKTDFEYVPASGEYKTKFKTFPNDKKFYTELSSVTLQTAYAELLYAPTATFTLAREWKVSGQPFRTTWSTGWYINYLRYSQKLRSGKSTLVLRMDEDKTTAYIRRPGDKIVQALPESAAKYGEELKSLSDYFTHDNEEAFLKTVSRICKEVGPDRIFADLGECYYTEKNGSTLPALVRRKIDIFGQLNMDHNMPAENVMIEEE